MRFLRNWRFKTAQCCLCATINEIKLSNRWSTWLYHFCTIISIGQWKKFQRGDPLIYYSAWIWRTVTIFSYCCREKVTHLISFFRCIWHTIPSHAAEIWWNTFWELCMATPYLVLWHLSISSLIFSKKFFKR